MNTGANQTPQPSMNTGDFTPEFYVHSQECSELATHRESENTADLKSEVITKEDRKKRRRELNDIKKALRDDKMKLKLSKISPTRRAKLEEKIAERAERKAVYNMSSGDDKKHFKQINKEHRLKRKNDRLLRKAEILEIKLAKMSPMRAEQFLKKIKEREYKRQIVKNMTRDEKKIYKQKRKEARLENKKKWSFLADKWSTEILEVECLIIDGNNIRGGGPKRHSRDEVIQHVEKVVNHHEQLKNTKVICIFDHKIATYTEVNKINVQFSGDQIADDVIVNTLVVPGVDTMVITCDRELAHRLFQKNCKVMRNMEFMRTVPGFESKYKRTEKSPDGNP